MLHDHDDHVVIAVHPHGRAVLRVHWDPVSGLANSVGKGAQLGVDVVLLYAITTS